MPDDVEETVSAQQFDFGKKKKKKPASKKVEVEEKEAKEVEEEKPVEKAAPAQTTAAAPADDADDDDDAPELKMKDVPADDDTAFVDDDKAAETESTERKAFVLELDPKDERDYLYKELAGRIFSLIARPEERQVYKMKPPVVYREGTKKTVWVNFPDICKIMNRAPDHVMQYFLAEVGSTGSIDGSGRLIVKGRFQPKHVENLLRSYISEYVKCHTCKGPETVLKKENRLLFVACEKCGSTRSVVAVKSGFQAETRAKRRAARSGTT